MNTILIGFDAFDPAVFERLAGAGRLPNLEKYAQAGGYAQFAVSNPAQSEVSWTSIATGANPGEHGLFDFVHRDPAAYALYVSLLPVKSDLLGARFVPPYQARTIFDQAAADGYPATALFWPAGFPARLDSPVRVIPGLGTPDLHGKLGVGCAFSLDQPGGEPLKTPVELLKPAGKDRYQLWVKGPGQKKNGGGPKMLEFNLEVTGDRSARLRWGRQEIELVEGDWSPVIELPFDQGLFVRIRAVTRVIMTQTRPEPRLYFLPLQIHPLHAPWPYASPPGFARQTWQQAGPYLTLGWPQDTTGLEEGWIDDRQFADLCSLIDAERERVFFHHLAQFEEGLLGVVFDTLDRVQHMFWRDRPDIVDDWYCRLDALVGRVEEQLRRQGAQDTRLLIVSDHGFTGFDYKVHLNRWLEQNGFLARGDPDGAMNLRSVDWAATQAYAVGLNSVYLNLEGREGQGSVSPQASGGLLDRLREALSEWRGPDGRYVAQRVTLSAEAFQGPLAANGPDIVVGYSPGYRVSAETGLGAWKEEPVEANRDHWGADHCIDPLAVPGVLFASRGLAGIPNPSYRDIPALALDRQIDPGPGGGSVGGGTGGEDEKTVEERLKSLGYL